MDYFLDGDTWRYTFNLRRLAGGEADGDLLPIWRLYRLRLDGAVPLALGDQDPIATGVCAKHDDAATLGQYRAEGLIDVAGAYTADHPYEVRIRATVGGVTESEKGGRFWVVSSERFPYVGDLSWPTLTVTVRDDGGAPLENVYVVAVASGAPGGRGRSALTDAAGEAVLYLSDGNYTVRALPPAGYNADSDAVVMAGVANTLDQVCPAVAGAIPTAFEAGQPASLSLYAGETTWTRGARLPVFLLQFTQRGQERDLTGYSAKISVVRVRDGDLFADRVLMNVHDISRGIFSFSPTDTWDAALLGLANKQIIGDSDQLMVGADVYLTGSEATTLYKPPEVIPVTFQKELAERAFDDL